MFKGLLESFICIHVLTFIFLFTLYGQTQALAENYLQPDNLKEADMPEKIVKTDEEWRNLLSP